MYIKIYCGIIWLGQLKEADLHNMFLDYLPMLATENPNLHQHCFVETFRYISKRRMESHQVFPSALSGYTS